MPTATALFARARGVTLRPGPHHCWYCASPCDETHSAGAWVKGNNTSRQYAGAPSSDYVCCGCAASLNESATVQVSDEPEQRTGARVRNYCWVVTECEARAFTKAHIEDLQRICLDPPPPPYVVVLSTSGQKQLLWQARVCRSSEWACVQLDEETITYRPSDLLERSLLTEAVCAATGKPALGERPGFGIYRGLRALDPAGGIELADRWSRVWCDPLSRLAAWLTPRKEICIGRCEERRARASTARPCAIP